MKIKKLLLAAMTCALAIIFAFAAAGCDIGNYSGATKDPGSSAGQGGDEQGGETPAGEESLYTVTIVEDGEVFLYTQGVKAKWRSLTDGSVYEAEFNADHVATSPVPLDGNYQVTLSGFGDEGSSSEGYTYNTNAYVATSLAPDVSIEAIVLSEYKSDRNHNGDTQQSAFELSDVGVYRVQIDSAEDEVYFLYYPPAGGTYGVRSWVDATADEINPCAKYYVGSQAYWGPATIYTGGDETVSSGVYTQNFKFDIELTDDMVGGGFRFSLSAASRYGSYPVIFDFYLARDGGYEMDSAEVKIILPDGYVNKLEDPVGYQTYIDKMSEGGSLADADVGTGTLSMIVSRQGSSAGLPNYVFDSELVDLSVDDGYYHLKNEGDEEGHPTGPLVYMYLSSKQPFDLFNGRSFTNIEYESKPLNMPMGLNEDGKNEVWDYRLCLYGYKKAMEQPAGGGDRSGGKSSSAAASSRQNAFGRPYNYDAYTDLHGYAEYCNSDGMYPVNEQLKEFLTNFIKSQRLYNDRYGMADHFLYNGAYYDAYEDSMWLLFCAYYQR